MNFVKAISIAASGLIAQNSRIGVIAENIANADSLPTQPGAEPYRRKTINFKNVLDRVLGVDTVRVADVSVDRSDFGRRYDPAHPAADAEGFVLTPNVKMVVEMMDLREAQRGYEANLRVIDVARTIVGRTIELLR
ncbi:MAG: flagellar basal body rod protein FlgC [Alphaproteobacteria bacterium]